MFLQLKDDISVSGSDEEVDDLPEMDSDEELSGGDNYTPEEVRNYPNRSRNHEHDLVILF